MASNRLAIGSQIYQYFLDKGLPPYQAAAAAANMAWEGGGRANLVNPGDNYKNSPAAPHSVGVGQWNDRSRALFDYARSQGIDLPQGDMRNKAYVQDAINRIPLKTQLDFAWDEMHGPERYAFGKLTSSDNLHDANAGAIGYHRPAGYSRGNPEGGHAFNQRMQIAQDILRAGGQPIKDETIVATATDPAPAAKEGSGKMGLFSMLGSMGSLPGLEDLDMNALDKQAGDYFGSIGKAFNDPSASGGKGSGFDADGDMKLAMQGMQSADKAASEGDQMQGVRKPFDMAQLQALLQRAGKLGTLPRSGGGGMA